MAQIVVQTDCGGRITAFTASCKQLAAAQEALAFVGAASPVIDRLVRAVERAETHDATPAATTRVQRRACVVPRTADAH